MKGIEFVRRAYNYIKDHGYTRNETSDYVLNNNLEPEIDISDFKVWIEENKDKSDYFHNVYSYVTSGEDLNNYWEYNTISSALNIFFKDKRNAEEAEKSTFQGNVGDKITFKVKDFKSIYYGDWGNVVYRIVGTDNNIYIWSTSNYSIEVGDEITAKIKAHREYRNEKQTVVTRGKIISSENVYN